MTKGLFVSYFYHPLQLTPKPCAFRTASKAKQVAAFVRWMLPRLGAASRPQLFTLKSVFWFYFTKEVCILVFSR